MKKITKIIAVLLIIAVALSLTACGRDAYTPAEKFAARANLTIDHVIWQYLPEAVSYTFSTLEYYEEGTARVIRADCNFRVGAGLDIVTNVFMLSDRRDYLVRYNNRNDADFAVNEHEYTGLWYINLGSEYVFEVIEDNLIDSKKARDLVLKYRETEDKKFLGME